MFVHLKEKPFSEMLLEQYQWTLMWETGVIVPEWLVVRELLELCWAVVVLWESCSPAWHTGLLCSTCPAAPPHQLCCAGAGFALSG